MSNQPISVPFVSFRPLEKELDADLRGAFDRVLANSWYIEGREDEAFEKAFAAYCGTEYCIGCGNGLDSLVLILKAMGIGPGDEVIVFGPGAAPGADTADTVAEKTGTINYEIICGISRRVPRVYLQDGRAVRIWNDLEEG